MRKLVQALNIGGVDHLLQIYPNSPNGRVSTSYQNTMAYFIARVGLGLGSERTTYNVRCRQGEMVVLSMAVPFACMISVGG